jgi:hypothetical protein
MGDKLFISDERMLALMKWAIDKGISESERKYLESINFPRQNIGPVRQGKLGFTKDQILNAAKITGANINWIFGLEGNMLRKPSKSSIDLLKEAVVTIEQEMKKKK